MEQSWSALTLSRMGSLVMERSQGRKSQVSASSTSLANSAVRPDPSCACHGGIQSAWADCFSGKCAIPVTTLG